MAVISTFDPFESDDLDQRIRDLITLIETDREAASEAVAVILRALDEMNAGGDGW